MKVYEFGTEHEKTFVMFQCAAEPWWVFRDSAEAMARDYHVYLVIADGHDEQGTTFVSIEKNASDAAAYLRAKGVRRIDGLYGVSMGGASAMRFLATYAPALLPEGQAPAAPGRNPEDSPGLVAPARSVRQSRTEPERFYESPGETRACACALARGVKRSGAGRKAQWRDCYFGEEAS